MKSPTMLYKHPGKHKIHGDMFDYTIVAAADVRGALSDGWSLTTTAALEAVKPVATKAAPKKRGRPARKA